MRGPVHIATATIAAFLVCSTTSAVAAPPAKYIYWVDVRRALLGTADGKKVAQELDQERARTDAELSRLERELGEQQQVIRKNPTRVLLGEYEKKAQQLEEALTAAEMRLLAIESTRIQPVMQDVREVIDELNRASKQIQLLEIDRHAPINLPVECDATAWLLARLEKPGKKPLAKRSACSIKFFMYVDVDRLKLEMKATSDKQRELEAVREERLGEIVPVVSSTATPLTRIELFLKYTELQKQRRDREQKSEASMMLTATAFVWKTARPMKGVIFLDAPENGAERLSPSCEVTHWLIELEHGSASMADVARDCKCVWLNREGTKVRIARGCGG
jgi:Skp family chaperone for outer membrane proteins